jgi:hypothetical protein
MTFGPAQNQGDEYSPVENRAEFPIFNAVSNRETIEHVASKILTRAQAQSRKDAAVRFAENVLDDSDKADDIESESLDDWVARKRITLIHPRRGPGTADNPAKRSPKMANGNGDPRTKAELLDEIDQLHQENADLQDQLDAIADIVAPSDNTGDDEGDDDDDQDDDDQ